MNPIFFYETYKKNMQCFTRNRQTSYSLSLFLNFYRQI